MNDKLSQKITNMGFVCAILVVAIHVPFADRMPMVQFLFREIVAEGVARIAVPYYFIVSGYFLAQHFWTNGYYKIEVWKRIRSLVIPYFLWQIIGIIVVTPLHIIADIIAHRPFGASVLFFEGRWINALGFNLTGIPILGQLWYIRCLFVFVIFCFLFKFLVERFGYWWIGMSFLLLLGFKSGWFSVLHADSFFDFGISLIGVTYFSMGMMIKMNEYRGGGKISAIIALLVSLVLLIIKTVLNLNGTKCVIDLQTLMVPFLLYAVFYFMSDRAWPKWLTSCTFPIFLMHWLFLIYFTAISKHLQINGLVIDVVGLLIGVIGSVAVAIFLRRYCKRAAKILFGGR